MSFQFFFWKNHSPPKCIWQDHQNLHEVRFSQLIALDPTRITDAMPNMIHIFNQKSNIFHSKTTQNRVNIPYPPTPTFHQTHPFELRTLRAVADHPNRTCLVFWGVFFPTLKKTCSEPVINETYEERTGDILHIKTDSLVLVHEQYLETSVLTSYFSNDFYSYRCLWIESKQEEQEMR